MDLNSIFPQMELSFHLEMKKVIYLQSTSLKSITRKNWSMKLLLIILSYMILKLYVAKKAIISTQFKKSLSSLPS